MRKRIYKILTWQQCRKLLTQRNHKQKPKRRLEQPCQHVIGEPETKFTVKDGRGTEPFLGPFVCTRQAENRWFLPGFQWTLKTPAKQQLATITFRNIFDLDVEPCCSAFVYSDKPKNKNKKSRCYYLASKQYNFPFASITVSSLIVF